MSGALLSTTDLSLSFGGVHAVSLDGEAAGDPRRGGHALVLEER